MAIILINGKLRLVGGKPLLTPAPVVVVVGGATTGLTLVDFQSSWATAKPVIQRKPGSIMGDVPVMFNFTGSAPAGIQARVVKSAGGAVVKDWTALSTITVLGQTGLGTLVDVPQGVGYLMQVRDGSQPANAPTISNGVQVWGVGVCILYDGQSNMVSTLNGGSYADIVPGTALSEFNYFASAGAVGSLWDGSGFHGPSNGSNGPGGSSNAPSLGGGTLSAMRIIANGLQTKYGYPVPVCLILQAFNGAAIASFFYNNAGGTFYTLLNSSGTTPGTIGFASPKNMIPGDFEGVVRHQGEANQSDSRASYFADLKTLYGGYLAAVAPHGRTAADLFFVPAVLGVYASQLGIEKIRGAVLDLDAYARANNWPKVRAGWNCIDLDPTDGGDSGLHFRDTNQPYAKRSARRSTQAALFQLGCSSFSGLGPRLSATATRAGLVATLTVLHDGGSSVVTRAGGAPSGFYANTAADFSGTAIAVTASIVGNAVQVTFPTGTVFPAYVKYMGNAINSALSYLPDISNAIYDNVQYPAGATGSDVFTGLPLVPTPDSIAVN